MTRSRTDPLRGSTCIWIAIASTLAVGSLLVHVGGRSGSALASAWAQAIDWQPALARAEPWRAWSAVFVHYSGLHLVANLIGALGVAAWGGVARVPPRCVVAWLIAWPLVQAGLLMQPELRHYGGLSGVLHSGVAVVAVHLLCAGTPVQRRIGAAVLAALVLKLLTESPWTGPISHPPGWDIAVAPGAHVSGGLAGSAVAALAEAWHRARTR